MGYGDIGVYGAKGLKTPAIDQLAAEGAQFTDAHCTAATCTPSRYSLLTGSYAFRNKAAVLPGDAPLIIDPQLPTLPKMLQQNGYRTAVIGKWHLGLGRGNINWNERVGPGPKEIGFDYSFILPSTGDRVPTVYMENQQIVGLDPNDPVEVSYAENISDRPTGMERPDLLKMGADPQHSGTITNGVSRIGYMKGGESALWEDETLADMLSTKAKEFIGAADDKPFFLYYALHDIHVPRVPNSRFVGKSGMGPRGDAILQMDWAVSELMDALAQQGLLENTLVIFTSDNGPVLDDGYADRAVELLGEHKPSGDFGGGKYSVLEAGTRVPTIVYWKGRIKPGTKSNAMLSQVDLYASFASLVGHSLAGNEAPDSFNMLESWRAASTESRPYLVEEAYAFAVRKNGWKYITAGGATPDWLAVKGVRAGWGTSPRLYHLKEDMAEQQNVIGEHTSEAQELASLWEEVRTAPTRPDYQKQQ
ncbi:arylsulfatase [Pontibacter sp. E15-1]|nr:arylsulfatase [Pontibacter sp. E15-1]